MEKTTKGEVIRLFQFCPECKQNSVFLVETCIPSINENAERFNRLRLICVFCSKGFYLKMPSNFELIPTAGETQTVTPTKADFKRTRSLENYAKKTQIEAELAKKNIKRICSVCKKPIEFKFIMRFRRGKSVLICPDCETQNRPATAQIPKT